MAYQPYQMYNIDSMSINEQPNYFELFNLPLVFLIDQDKLEDTYLKLQASFHPDKYASADVLQRSIAAKQSSLINIAYKELLNPTKRATHLLRISSGGGADAFNGENTIADTEFLMEQMKWREAIEGGDGDAANLRELLKEIQQTQEQIYKDFEDAYTQYSKNFAIYASTNNTEAAGLEKTKEKTEAKTEAKTETEEAGKSVPAAAQESINQLGGLLTKMQYFGKLEQDLESRLP